jgi:quinol monooxygenase YgiN
MVTAFLKILPLNEKYQEALDILQAVKGPVMSEPGCLSWSIYEEYGDERNILVVEQWKSMADLERHIRSSGYSRILEAMELSFTIPELYFYGIGDETWGFGLIERLRTDSANKLRYG